MSTIAGPAAEIEAPPPTEKTPLKRSQTTVNKIMEEEDTDAMVYHDSTATKAAGSRMLAVCITFSIELLPAFVIVEGTKLLQDIPDIKDDQIPVFAGFMAVVSAVSGNVGLQSSTLITRSISHLFVTKDNWKEAFIKEVTVAAIIGIAMAMAAGLMSGWWAESLKIGVCIGLAQFLSIVTAGITGTFSPLFFKLVLNRDPGTWAGPMETAIQDVVASAMMFYISGGLLSMDWGRSHLGAVSVSHLL